MADTERFTASLQVAVLTALCFDSKHGAAIASQVTPSHFDDLWRSFATGVLRYRRSYGRPPGKTGVEDIASQATIGKHKDLLQKQLLPQVYAEADSLNGAYVLSRTSDFVRRQILKGALFEAGDRFNQDNEQLVPDIEGILQKALRYKQHNFSAGVWLNDPNALQFTETEFLSLDIPALDKLRIGMVAKELLLYIGPKGSGKSWFCVHCGKQAVMKRQKVLHVTLEMPESQVIPRYYQALFGVARTKDKFTRPVLTRDEMDRIINFTIDYNASPSLHFNQPNIRKVLRTEIGKFGSRFGDLIVKEFPTRSLTIDHLLGYLDYLQEVKGFVPSVLIVDYPKLMRTTGDDLRIGLGRNMEDLRGIAGARNMAVVAPHQGTRSTIGGKYTRSTDASEDISVVQTADTVLAYSRTDAEERQGTGRLSVEHSRSSQGGARVLLMQSYATGQYVLDSTSMLATAKDKELKKTLQKVYWDKLKVDNPDTVDDTD